ncbi:hypothetical protein ACE1CB_18835 [Aerosakkonema sp. BLCC-F2]|uniref:hypothetical protein n=1 Tax=Aerosakkonema sp. BLCC-F183 TaxID=3342834 RepID=UPI0035BAAE12
MTTNISMSTHPYYQFLAHPSSTFFDISASGAVAGLNSDSFDRISVSGEIRSPYQFSQRSTI